MNPRNSVRRAPVLGRSSSRTQARSIECVSLDRHETAFSPPQRASHCPQSEEFPQGELVRLTLERPTITPEGWPVCSHQPANDTQTPAGVTCGISDGVQRGVIENDPLVVVNLAGLASLKGSPPRGLVRSTGHGSAINRAPRWGSAASPAALRRQYARNFARLPVLTLMAM